MEIKNRLFPYPVLSNETNDYVESRFEVSVEYSREINEIILSFTIELDNPEIQHRINKGEAYFGIHIECSKTAYRKFLRTSQKSLSFRISESIISGDIVLLGFIIAKDDIPYYTNPMLNEAYEDVDIMIPKAGIIAYYTMPKIRVTKNYEELKSSESLFCVVKRHNENDDIRPIEFELDTDKIRIMADETTYSSYVRYSMDDNAQNLIWSLLLFPAIVYMLEHLRYEGIEPYEETVWYQMIASSYAKQGYDFAEIVEKSDASITEIAQKMLRLPISKSFDNLRMISGGDFE